MGYMWKEYSVLSCLFLLLLLPLVLCQPECSLSNFEVGDQNITFAELQRFTKKHPSVLVGFSASYCTACCAYEPFLSDVQGLLAVNPDTKSNKKIPFVRIDVASNKELTDWVPFDTVPGLIFVRKGKPYLYEEGQEAALALGFIHRISNPVRKLKSYEEVESLLATSTFSAATPDALSPPKLTVRVVCFVGAEEKEEYADEVKDFRAAAANLVGSPSIYFGIVTNSSVVVEAKQKKLIKSSPSLLLVRRLETAGGSEEKSFFMRLDELTDVSIERWINSHSIRPVEHLHPRNFHIVASLERPMLVLFLNLSSPAAADQKENRRTISVLEQLAPRFSQISFVYVDGVKFAAKKRALGITSDSLPAIAYNLKDNRRFPFPHTQPITFDTVYQFCHDFLSLKLQPYMDPSPASVPSSVASGLDAESLERMKHVVPLTTSNFEKEVLQEGKDVVVMFYSTRDCEDCKHLYPYYGKTAERFLLLNISSVSVAAMDMALHSQPHFVTVGRLPQVLFFPAYDKKPPYRVYVGKGKVKPMMEYVQAQADIKFTLPELPHLNAEEQKAYWVQKKQMDEWREQERLKKEQEEQERAKREQEGQEAVEEEKAQQEEQKEDL